jgi:cytochrome c oxidase subunit 1
LHPLWAADADLPVMTGLRTDRREVLLTTTFDADPDVRHAGPASSIWPPYLALCMGVLFIGSIFSPYFVLAGLAVVLPGLFGWGWQSTRPAGRERIAVPGFPVVEQL